MIVIQSNRFLYLGKPFEAIPKDHETDLTNYDETMSSDDVILWQGAMDVKLEFIYLNGV